MSTNDCYDDNLNPNPQGGGTGDPGLGSVNPPNPPIGPRPNNGDTRQPHDPVDPPDIEGGVRPPYLPPGIGPDGNPIPGVDPDPDINPTQVDPRRYAEYRQTYTGRLDDTENKRNIFILDRKTRLAAERDARNLAREKKEFNKRKNECKEKADKGGKKKPKKRFCICPTCSPLNMVLDKISGKNFFTLPFSNFKVPRPEALVEKSPTFDQNRREGEVCGSCEGTKKITDPTDDSAKYQEVAQKIEEKSEKIMEQEAKLGLGGARTTYIQGNDALFVGLGFNNNQTYEVVPDSNIAPTMKGGKIPQQNSTKVNTVVGKQGATAWPQGVGNYMIKCANKFNLLAGAGGVTIATPGPLTFSSGILKFVGPQITIGCASGPLTLEGNSVNVSGKTIALTPTGGEVFVKGNISNTGNVTCQGHAHFESVSFPKGSCVGVTKSTYTALANPDVLQTTNAAWAKAAVTGATTEMKALAQSIPMDSKSSAFRSQTPGEAQNKGNRAKAQAKLAAFVEYAQGTPMNGTAFILPGTSIQMNGTNPCNLGGIAGGVISGTTIALIPVHNVPHAHSIPEMMHKHEILLPDLDYTADSAQALRDKTINPNQESGVPADPTKDTQTRTDEVKRTQVELNSAKQLASTSASHKGGMI